MVRNITKMREDGRLKQKNEKRYITLIDIKTELASLIMIMVLDNK